MQGNTVTCTFTNREVRADSAVVAARAGDCLKAVLDWAQEAADPRQVDDRQRHEEVK
jgi:hypothetical protein